MKLGDNMTFEKYWWIESHPYYNKLTGAKIEITPHKVNPENNTIEKDITLNTKLQWWVEVSYEIEDDNLGYCFAHDWKCDTGGDTIDEAISKLYDLVLKEHGDY